MLENPNIAAQERHNNRTYLDAEPVYKPSHGCSECGEMLRGRDYTDGLCDDCRDPQPVGKRSSVDDMVDFHVHTVLGQNLMLKAFDEAHLLRWLAYQNVRYTKVRLWSEHVAEQEAFDEAVRAANANKLRTLNAVNAVKEKRKRSARRAQ